MLTFATRITPTSPLLRLAGSGLDLVLRLWRHRQERRVLMAMSDALLADIGLSRADIDRELARPLREPVHWAELNAARRRASAAPGRRRR